MSSTMILEDPGPLPPEGDYSFVRPREVESTPADLPFSDFHLELKARPGCCEEASPASLSFYIPCNAPAVKIVQFRSGEGPYRMCEPCAYHNTRNRGAHYVSGEIEGVAVTADPV